jgi:hypothetical protein
LKRSFRFTPLTLAVIQRHARDRRSVAAIATIVGAEVSTVENICRKHGIEVAMRDGAAPTVVPPALPSGPFVDPMLDPARRKARNNLTTVKIEIANGALSVIEREAARRGTTSPILIARMSELIAQDGLFVAVIEP